MPDLMTSDQFAEKIKAKYPQYKDIPNADLTQKMLAKYPQYKSQIQTATPSVGQKVDAALAPHPEQGVIGRLREFARGAVAGIEQPFQHPVQTAEQMGTNLLAGGGAIDTPLSITGPYVSKEARELNERAEHEAQDETRQQGQEALQHPAYTAGTIIGPAVAGEAVERMGVAPKIAELRGKAAEGMRGAIRETTGVPENTEKVVDQFGKKAEVNRKKTAVQSRKEAVQRLETAKENRETGRKYEAQRGEVREHNEEILRQQRNRRATEEKLQGASKQMDERIETARKKAKAQNDKAWSDWREKTAGKEVASDPIVESIKSQTATMDPEDVAEFRKVLKESKPSQADMGEAEAERNDIAQGQFKRPFEKLTDAEKAHVNRVLESEGLDPDAVEETTKPVGANRLHVWKTQLEYAVRKATRGNVRHAIGQVLDQVRGAEDRLSAEAGATPELARARDLHGKYVDTFRNSPNEPQTVASKSLSETSPEYARDKAAQERLNMLGQYDPEILKLANHIDNLRKGMKSIPEKADLKPAPAKPEPKPMPKPKDRPEAPAAPNLQAENVKYISKTLRRYGRIGTWVLRLIVGGGAAAMSHGDVSKLSMDLLIGQTGVTILTRALRAPSVLEWLAKPSVEDIRMIESLPPQDAAKLKDALGALAEQEKSTGKAGHIDPRIAAALGLTGASIPKNRKEAVDRLKRTGT